MLLATTVRARAYTERSNGRTALVDKVENMVGSRVGCIRLLWVLVESMVTT